MNLKTHLISSIVFLCVGIGITSTVYADPKPYHDAECAVDRQLICQLDDTAYVTQLQSLYPMSVIDFLPEIYAYLICVDSGYDADSIAILCQSNPKVNYCTPNYVFDLPEVVQGSQPFVDRPGDENRYNEQPAATSLNLPQIDNIPTSCQIKVGVIDVGVDLQNPALAGSIGSGFDYVSGDLVPQDEPNGSASGHGTFVAGLIHRIMPEARIQPYRTLDTNGRGTGWLVAEGILQAIKDSCKVINLSLVMHEKHECVDAAIELARQHNIIVVAAAGNDSSTAYRYPAHDSSVVCVTAVDSTNTKASFANYGSHISVCAPGVHLYAPFPDSAFATWSGTSFAAPIVAAQAARLFSLKPTASWQEIVDAIKGSATNIDAINSSLPGGSLGAGLVNIRASITALGLICGDVDGSGGTPDVSDLTALTDNLFISFAPLPNPAVANIDMIDGVDIGDLTELVDHLFISLAPIDCGF